MKLTETIRINREVNAIEILHEGDSPKGPLSFLFIVKDSPDIVADIDTIRRSARAGYARELSLTKQEFENIQIESPIKEL